MLLDVRVPLLYVFNKIRLDLFFVTLFSLVTFFFKDTFLRDLPEIPIALPAFLGTSISVILSFKMNQSYDRWWESRKIWGAIVNDSRTFTIQILSYFCGNSTLIKKLAYRQIAWCYSLGQNLRNMNPLENISEFLSQEDIIKLKNQMNKSLSILQMNFFDLSEEKAKGVIDTFTLIQLDNTLIRLCDSMGKAERIKTTVFPTTYRKYLHFAIYLFVFILSISLKDIEFYFEFTLLLAISSMFFLIEKSATHLQDPYRNRPSDSPITAISRTIEINIRQLIGETDVPEPFKPNKFYLM